jgi:carnitine-CoA ligase
VEGRSLGGTSRRPPTALADRTIPRLLDGGASRWPDRPALRDAECTLTYAQLAAEADRRGSAVKALGISWQEPILFMLDNHLDHVLSWLGATYYGRIQAQVNTAYRGGVLENVVNNSGAATIVIEEEYLHRLAAIATELPALRTVVVRRGRQSGRPADPALPGGVTTLEFDDVMLAGPGGDREEEVEPWHRYGIMYTSGTTGPSKGVVQPHGLPFSYVSPRHWPLCEDDDVVLVALPQFHIAGQWTGVLAPLMVGASAALVPRFSATGFWDDVARFGVTQTTLIAAMAAFLMAQPELPGEADSTLTKVLLAPIPANADYFMRRFGVQLTCGLGQTEASAPIVAPYGTTSPRACGWPRDDFEIRVVDENDVAVAPGEVGEMVVRALDPWAAMIEYNKAPEATVRKWRNLWLHTGDMIRQDETGQVIFVDRSTDVIRRRGENISSVEVEAEILRQPSVRLAAVVGVDSADNEQEVKACVVPEVDQRLPEAELHAMLCDRLPYFMVPRYIEYYDELPQTPTHRVQKHELRQDGVTARTWDSRAHGVEASRADR